MSGFARKGALGLGLAASMMLAAAITPARAAPYTFNITYFTIAGTYAGPGSGDPDFNTIGCCTGVFTDEVLSNLGPNGLPLYNTASSAPVIHDVNGSGEITWWSPSFNTNVTQTGSGTITNPFQNYNMYPPNGTGSNDGSGFLGAIISGVMHLSTAEAVTFTLGVDDDAFLYVDGTIVTQEGGIHGVSDAPVSSPTLSAGDHDFKLFYVDRNVTGAGLHFDITSSDIEVNPPAPPVPEPATMLLLGSALAALGVTRRRRG